LSIYGAIINIRSSSFSVCWDGVIYVNNNIYLTLLYSENIVTPV